MIKRIIIRAKRFFWIRVFEAFKHNFSKKDKKTLVYLGLYHGSSFSRLIHSYETCYGFEANPKLYRTLKNKFILYKNVHIIHAAVTDYNGKIKFNLSDIKVRHHQ